MIWGRGVVHNFGGVADFQGGTDTWSMPGVAPFIKNPEGWNRPGRGEPVATAGVHLAENITPLKLNPTAGSWILGRNYLESTN